jgi:tetratricopeptide (TPR) repeat protein
MSSKIRQYFLPILIFIFVSFIYIHNLSRGVYGGDTGDFISASIVMGVAHPPGYPLFTLLGFLFTRLNIFTPAFMVGLVTALSSSLAVVIFYLISLKLSKSKLISVISSFILSFNLLFWFYAEIAEVFSLNILFSLILILLAIQFSERKKIMYFFLLSFVAGLSLTNHHTVVLIYPSILIITFKEFFKLIKKPKNILYSLLFFALGFSVYLYVPFASFFNPPVNWIPVNDIQSFLRLFLRSDYGTFNAGPFSTANVAERMAGLSIYFKYLVTQFTIPTVFLILTGLISSFKSNKRIFTAILIGFLLSGPIFIGYAGFPLINAFYIGINERFFLLSFVIVLLFVPFGLRGIGNITNKIFKKNIYEKLFIGIFIIIPLSLFYYNFPKTDLSNITIGDDFAYDYLSSLPKNSLFLVGGDTPLLNSWYIHYGLNYRRDITIVNINQTKTDSYYNKEKDEYLKKNPKDVNDPNFKLKLIKYISLKRPVYSSETISATGKFEKIRWVPYGLVNKFFQESDRLPSQEEYFSKNSKVWDSLKYFKNLQKQEKYLARGSLILSDIPSAYANSLLLTGNYVLEQYKNKESAEAFFLSAQKTAPNFYRSYQILGVYYFSEKECTKAKDYLKKAIDIYPFDTNVYYFLYSTYTSCLNDKKSADSLVNDYNYTFKSDFFKDVTQKFKDLKK